MPVAVPAIKVSGSSVSNAEMPGCVVGKGFCLASDSCGWWSEQITLTVLFLMPSRNPARSSLERSGGKSLHVELKSKAFDWSRIK